MTPSSQALHLKALGARILNEANDLKRTPEALAAELGIESSLVHRVIEGRADLTSALNLLHAMTNQYPISLADIWLDEDDTVDGVKVMSAAATAGSSRIFERRDRHGGESPYYDYRDTAMSRLAPFKPEWIEELRVVSNDDPDNPDVAYNNGHFLHQTTFFIGPVNFYWDLQGKRHCAEMNTGDSNYITPFVPHSFTSRDPNNLGLIIAITYAGQVGRARRELSAADVDALNAEAGDLRGVNPFLHRVDRHLNAESLSPEELRARLVDAGHNEQSLTEILAGRKEPTYSEIALVADALSVRPQDLVAVNMKRGEEVVVKRRDIDLGRNFPDNNNPAYRLVELARTKHQPKLKGFDVTVNGEEGAPFQHSLHEYVYNYGDDEVHLHWHGRHSKTLAPGDSAYIRPMIEHGFARKAKSEAGKLVMIRVPGQLTDDVFDEFAAFEVSGRDRVARETRRWF